MMRPAPVMLLGVFALLAVVLLPVAVQAGVENNSTTDRLSASTFDVVPATGTICFKVYPTWAQNDGADHVFFYIENGTDITKFDATKSSSDDGLYFGWTTAGADHRVNVAVGSYTLNQNQWNSFCLTWDDTANETKLSGSMIIGRDAGLVTA
jgi:hypothetical protein